MIFDKNIAKKTAELLLHINAIKLKPRKPLHGLLVGDLLFIVTTGWYFLICNKDFAKLIELAKNIENLYGKPDVITGLQLEQSALVLLLQMKWAYPLFM